MRRNRHPRNRRGSLTHVALAGVLLATLTLAGCSDTLMIAVGSTRDAGLASSFELSDRRVGALVGVLERPVQMVRPEPRFKVHVFEPGLLRGNRDWKTLAIFVNLSDPGSLGAPLREAVDRLLRPEQRDALSREPAGFRVVRDVWANGQAVLLVHTKMDEDRFLQWLASEKEAMLAAFEEGLQIALEQAVMAIGPQEKMERYVERRHGFHISIPKDYIAAEDAEGRVIRLYRVLEGQPPRFLLVYWAPAEDAPRTGDELLKLRDRLGAEYYDGDRVEFDRSSALPATFQDEPATLLSGIYQNRKYLMGGPFRSYAFTRGDRFFLIDAAVYNPPGDKLPYLREVLALGRTFRLIEPASDAG